MNENVNETSKTFDIDVWKLILAYLKYWWVIVLCTVIAAGAAMVYSANFITPQYSTSVTIYVNNTRSVNENQEYVSGGDLSTSARLVRTYTSMLTSDTVLEQVIQDTGLPYSADYVRGLISTSQVDDTELFRIYVRNTDPKVAAMIANAVAQSAPDAIADFVPGSSTRIIDYAKVPTYRSYPNHTRNTMMGAIIGAALSVVVLTLQTLLDVRVKDESDLNEMFNFPVLGQIPDLDQNDSKHGYYKAYQKYGQAYESPEGAENGSEQGQHSKKGGSRVK